MEIVYNKIKNGIKVEIFFLRYEKYYNIFNKFK